MGLFLRQADDRTKLQNRLAEELRERARSVQQTPGKQPEVTSDLLEDGEQTRPAGMILTLLALGICVAGVVWVASNF